MWLTRFSIKRPIIVAMLFIAIAAYGIASYFALGKNSQPNVNFPVVVVIANYPGASPAEMERLVVKPIEDQIDGIEHLDEMTATAQEGSAVVVVQFKLGTDLDFAAIDVQRRVDTARVYMPTDLDPPVVQKNGADAPVVTYAVDSKTLNASALADLLNNSVESDIRHIPTVQSVDLEGAAVREFDVDADPLRLMGAGATLSDVFNAIQQNNSNLPGGRVDAPTVETAVSVHAEINSAADIAALPLPITTGLLVQGSTLKIGDVATVTDTHQEQRLISHMNGHPGLIMDVNRTISSDEVGSTKIVRDGMIGIEKKYPQVEFHELFAPADYTQASLNGVNQSLIEGIVLTAIVLMLFLHAWRNALVVMVAIPASLFATFIVMRLLNLTLDNISLMGLSLTIGILVDDSIVVLENITRHRDLGQAPVDAAISGRTEIGGAAIAITLVDVVVFLPLAFLSGFVGQYLREFGIVVTVATLFSLFVSFTLTPVLAAKWSVLKRSSAPPPYLIWFQAGFERLTAWYKERALPVALRHRWLIFWMSGVAVLNAFSLPAGPAAMAVFAVADLAIALVVVGGWMIVGRVFDGRLISSRVLLAIVAGLAALVTLALTLGGLAQHAMPLVVVSGLLTLAFAALAFLVGSGRRRISGGIHVAFHQGGSNASVAGLVGIAAVLFVLSMTQSSVQSEFVPDAKTGQIHGDLTYPVGTPLAITERALVRIERAVLADEPGEIDTVRTYAGSKPDGWGETDGGFTGNFNITLRKDKRRDQDVVVAKLRQILPALAPGAEVTVSGRGGGGSGLPISYTLSGPPDQIGVAADKLAAYIRSLPGTVNVQTGAELDAPHLTVRVDPARAAVLGVSPGAAAAVARAAVGGVVATKVRTWNGLVNVLLQYPIKDRNSIAEIERIPVRSNDGTTMVPLSRVATFTWDRAPTKIEHVDKQVIVRVNGDIDHDKTTLGAVTSKIDAQLKVPGFLPTGVTTGLEGDTKFFKEFTDSMTFALITSILLIYCLMVILYGSFLTPFVIMFSIPVAIIGALLALAITHQTFNIFSSIGMVMLFGLVAKNGILLVDYANTLIKRGLTFAEAIVASGGTRLRPIMMTTSAMVFGMLPLALGRTEGAEFRQSMGVVLIGGLLSSLFLTLFLVPATYVTANRLAEWLRSGRHAEDTQADERPARDDGPSLPRVPAGAFND
ncbi:MAG TPA: efflux RND transporter permease subunit [Candidatus Sulfotelmatobacter sp.]|nr:efflux RND transporter permease subunit [Candidatus Sulfotelmatobacter sp.]